MSRISQMIFGEHDQFEIVEMNTDKHSMFGNYVMDIYDEDIEALKAGKKLVFIDEYGYILVYKQGKKQKPKDVSIWCDKDGNWKIGMDMVKKEDGSLEYPYDFTEVDG